MRKKRGKLLKHENIVVFPGAVERLIAAGHQYAENYQYDLAVKSLREALSYVEGDESTLGVYAFSLYETREFTEAKQVCEKILALGPTMYIEIMELYLTICMELKEFTEVEHMIDSLLDEGVVPKGDIPKFERLRDLNERIAQNRTEEIDDMYGAPVDAALYHLETFIAFSVAQQIQLLHLLNHTNIRELQWELVDIIESDDLHPIPKTIALILLVEQKVDLSIAVRKLNVSGQMNPSHLLFPDEMMMTKQVTERVNELLEQEPSTLEMVQSLINRHLIVTYPYGWLDYEVEEIAQGYVDYVHAMFGRVKETDDDFMEFLQLLDAYSEVSEHEKS